MNILLAGVVGSTAYGLNHAGSDIDRLGLYAAPTRAFHGLTAPPGTLARVKPDETLHEAGKGVRLMLATNPTAMELLWLEEYDTITPLGEELIAMRHAFISREGVRNAYLGYARGQFDKLGKLGFSMVNTDRRRKHARHLVRLLVQGTDLHRTGQLTIRLEDPEDVRDKGEEVFRNPNLGRHLLALAANTFNGPTPLPEHTDPSAANEWLHRVRDHYYEGPA